jgi:membrane-associated phospholipid phosphatase
LGRPTGRSRKAWADRIRAYIRFLLLFCLVFFPVYFGAPHVVEIGRTPLDIHFDWETAIPLIPWMVLPYLSLYTVFLLPVLAMTPEQMQDLTRQSLISLCAAFLLYVLAPARLGYAPTVVEGWAKPLFDVIAAVDTPHNLAPSLHIVFSALILTGCSQSRPRIVKLAAYGWLALMCASTLFVHQHHIADVAAGLALAAMARRIYPLSPVPA